MCVTSLDWFMCVTSLDQYLNIFLPNSGSLGSICLMNHSVNTKIKIKGRHIYSTHLKIDGQPINEWQPTSAQKIIINKIDPLMMWNESNIIHLYENEEGNKPDNCG